MEIRAAFRRLAKELHPDHNSQPDAPAQFRALTEAYHALINSERLGRHDEVPAPEYRAPEPEAADPVICSKCGKITVQPRHTVFHSVKSFLVFTKRTSYEGVFCADCARRTALRASAISAAAGWWGVPFGPIYTAVDIVCNAFGGIELPGSREKLLWQNALAFAARGDRELAYGLARLLRDAENDMIAHGAARLMEALRQRGVDPDAARLKPAGPLSPLATALQLGLAAIVPIAVALAVTFVVQDYWPDHWTADASVVTSDATDTLPADDIQNLGAVSVAKHALAPKAARCATPPQNGDVLQGGTTGDEEQNRLVIANGHARNAIVKVRDATTNKVIVSFFVAPNSTATYAKIPDGRYNIQYAFGGRLNRSCTTFLSIRESAADPHPETFATQANDTGSHFQELSFKLYPVPNGNFQPEPIDAATFNAN
jgi:hypothetical protein